MRESDWLMRSPDRTRVSLSRNYSSRTLILDSNNSCRIAAVSRTVNKNRSDKRCSRRGPPLAPRRLENFRKSPSRPVVCLQREQAAKHRAAVNVEEVASHYRRSGVDTWQRSQPHSSLFLLSQSGPGGNGTGKVFITTLAQFSKLVTRSLKPRRVMHASPPHSSPV